MHRPGTDILFHVRSRASPAPSIRPQRVDLRCRTLANIGEEELLSVGFRDRSGNGSDCCHSRKLAGTCNSGARSIGTLQMQSAGILRSRTAVMFHASDATMPLWADR